MRIYRYRAQSGAARVAIAGSGPPIDLSDAWARAEGSEEAWLGSTLALIEQGPTVWTRVAAAIAQAPSELAVDDRRSGFRWLRPLDKLASLRDFLAFESHVRRGAERRGGQVPDYWFEAPVYYKGNHREVIGPEEDCPWPSYTDRLDFELELAMIVGVRGRDISPGDAGRHIFGFSIMNDFSARDIQAREMSTWLGPAKGKDFATAIGPCIVTVDEIGPDPDLAMMCRVNGEEWGSARSSEARWTWADMIAHVSRSEDVYPGDVYGSGTPGGCCGLDLGRELKPGDVVELEIEKIGVLRNTIGRPE